MSYARIGTAAALLSAIVCAAPQPVDAQRARPVATTVKAEDVGLTKAGVQRLVAALNDEVKAGNIPGGVLVVGRRGRTPCSSRSGSSTPNARRRWREMRSSASTR